MKKTKTKKPQNIYKTASDPWIFVHSCVGQNAGKQVHEEKCVCIPDGDSAQDAPDFNWDDYLEETEAVAVPHHSFKHVGVDNLDSLHTFLDKLVLAIYDELHSFCVKSSERLVGSNFILKFKLKFLNLLACPYGVFINVLEGIE